MKKYAFYISIVYYILFFTGIALASSPVQTEHFRVIAQGGNIEASELKKIGDEVEDLYGQVSDALGTEYKSSGKIEVRVYVTPEKGRAIRAAAGAATLYLTLGKIDKRVLMHELTHILIAKPLSTAPRWFHEGLAMYISYGDIRNARKKNLPPFEDFSFTRLEARFGADKTEQISYMYAWSIVSYVMDTCGKDKIKDIYKQSGTFSDKFSKAFGISLPSIEKKASGIFAKYK